MPKKKNDLTLYEFLKSHQSEIQKKVNQLCVEELNEYSEDVQGFMESIYSCLVETFITNKSFEKIENYINELMIFASVHHIDFDDVMKVTTYLRYQIVKVLLLEFGDEREEVIDKWLMITNRLDHIQELMLEYAVSLHKKKIRETEIKYRKMVEDIREGLVNVNYDFQVTFINSPLCDLMGKAKNEVVGKNLSEIISKEAFEMLSSIKRDYEKTGKEAGPFEMEIKNGDTSVSIEITPSVIYEERKPVGFQATVRDITERKQMETKLKERYEKMQQAYLELGKVNRQMASLIDISSIISADIEPEQVFDFILSSIAILSEADSATLRKYNPDKKTLELVATHKMAYVWDKGKVMQVKESVSGRTITTGAPVRVSDIKNDKSHKYKKFILNSDLTSIYAIPLQIAGNVIGTLTLYSFKEDKFKQLDQNFLSALVGHAAIALKMYT